jgi:ABC-2 type transport system ATP-binding protein
MDFAVKTEKLGRVYKIRGTKKNESKELVALNAVDLQVERGKLFSLWAERRQDNLD